MTYDNERPTKRIRLEQTSIFKCRSISPVHEEIPEQDFKYDNRKSLLGHQRQLEYPTFSVPSKDSESARDLQNKQYEATQTSPSPSHATSPHESQCFTDCADLVCFGSVGALPDHSLNADFELS